MPNSVKQLYNEAALISNKSPRAACALLRLAVDKLCLELGETDRDINKNIGALVKRGLSQDVQQALDIVRVVGNKAVHPGQIAFDVDDYANIPDEEWDEFAKKKVDEVAGWKKAIFISITTPAY